MTQQPITLKEFAAMVDDMRTKQKQYFGGRSTARLNAAKVAEKKVDAWLAEIKNIQMPLFKSDNPI